MTAVLTDMSDYGNGRALVSPQNIVAAELSPSSHAFETMPSNERFHSLASHELVHIATMDAWNQTDRAWRRFFGGKPRETDEHPETISTTTCRRRATARRAGTPEGSAVFMETWLSGGIGRAQGGYDEMVFRAMVRDDAHFYEPAGRGVGRHAADFQTMATAYLYGTRFFSYLALEHTPEKVVDWLGRDERQRALLRHAVRARVRQAARAAWSDWIAWEHGSRRRTSPSVRRFPVTAGKPVSPRTFGSVSRVLHRPGRQR